MGVGHVPDELQMHTVVDPEYGNSWEMELRPEVCNPHGSLHGGLMTALIECGAAGIAEMTVGSSPLPPCPTPASDSKDCM